MLYPLVLICLVGTPQEQCTRDAAIDVIQAEPSALPFACLSHGMFAAAKFTAAQPHGKDGVYVRVTCEHRS